MSFNKQDFNCPLCMDELDIADRNFKPCVCGYQICRFCWHHIKTNLNDRCPACRRLYDEQQVEFIPVSQEVIRRLEKEKKEKERQKRGVFNQLSNIRVVQKNLVYVLGVSSKHAYAESEIFRKYGKIDKVVLSKHPANTTGIYLTFIRNEDANKAIEGLNEIEFEGRKIRASFGTTKYCFYYLKRMDCPHINCLYLHGGNDSSSKNSMSVGKHPNTSSSMQIDPASFKKKANTELLTVPKNVKQQFFTPRTLTPVLATLDENDQIMMKKFSKESKNGVKNHFSLQDTQGLPSTASWDKDKPGIQKNDMTPTHFGPFSSDAVHKTQKPKPALKKEKKQNTKTVCSERFKKKTSNSHMSDDDVFEEESSIQTDAKTSNDILGLTCIKSSDSAIVLDEKEMIEKSHTENKRVQDFNISEERPYALCSAAQNLQHSQRMMDSGSFDRALLSCSDYNQAMFGFQSMLFINRPGPQLMHRSRVPVQPMNGTHIPRNKPSTKSLQINSVREIQIDIRLRRVVHRRVNGDLACFNHYAVFDMPGCIRGANNLLSTNMISMARPSMMDPRWAIRQGTIYHRR